MDRLLALRDHDAGLAGAGADLPLEGVYWQVGRSQSRHEVTPQAHRAFHFDIRSLQDGKTSTRFRYGALWVRCLPGVSTRTDTVTQQGSPLPSPLDVDRV